MATTTNYGWTTPNDTDLVKDGAAAIRTLGSSIDTTTKNLNPSTTLGDIEYRSSTANTNTRLGIGSSGQVLTVAAGVPSWATPSTYTSPLTTKGDLFTRTASADARLAVGTNGYYLSADSAETTGLKWVAPAGGTFAGVRANNSTAAQTIPNATKTVLTFSAENFDTDAYHSTSTNTGRLTVPTGKAGYYRIYYSVQWIVNGTGRRAVDLFLNGTTTCICTGEITVSGASYPSCNGSTTYYLNDGDYVNIAAYQTSGGNLDTNAGGFDHFGMEKIG